MRIRLLLLTLALAATILAVPTAPAVPAPAQFFETTVVADTPSDFSANGALDIVAVHVAEKYSFDIDNSTGRETVQFRIELRNREEFRNIAAPLGETKFTYILGYKVGGTAAVHSVEMSTTCSAGTGGPDCTPPRVPAPHATHQDFGVTVIIDAVANGLVPGATVTDVYAMSATSAGGSLVYQDLAPKDNANVSEGQEPTPAVFGDPIVLQGTYPFIEAQPKGPSNRFAVPGNEASYVVQFRTVEGLVGVDTVRVFYQAPEGWTITSTVEPPAITVQGGGEEFDLGFSAKAPQFAKVGDTATIILEAILTKAGGRALMATTTTVTEARISDPLYSFDLATKGPFKAGDESSLRASVQRDGVPLLYHSVKMDFVKDGQVTDTVTATGGSDGSYAANYTFPSSGAWTVDLYVADFLPAPHATFPVEVQGDGGGLPGFEVVAALGALALAFLWRRR